LPHPLSIGSGGSARDVVGERRRSVSGEDMGGAEQGVARSAPWCSRLGARWVPGLGEQVEVRARQWLPGGGHGSSGSGEQAARLGQHVGV
jgi:hypothetical protein